MRGVGGNDVYQVVIMIIDRGDGDPEWKWLWWWVTILDGGDENNESWINLIGVDHHQVLQESPGPAEDPSDAEAAAVSAARCTWGGARGEARTQRDRTRGELTAGGFLT